MDIINSQFTFFTEVIRGVLVTLHIQPESYRFLFPAGKDAETIRQLVGEGVFPTIPGLAPAVVYAIIFSALRFLFQYGFLKVMVIIVSISLVFSTIFRRVVDTLLLSTPSLLLSLLISILVSLLIVLKFQQFAQACLKITLTYQKKNSEIDAAFPMKNKKKIEV
jgi:hypothetical protein